MKRRDVLRFGAATGGTTAITLAPVDFAQAAPAPPGEEETRTVRGHLDPGAPDFVYLPVEVPRGVRRIAVSYAYDRPEVPDGTQGNALDIGIFDERGTALPGAGFRGWSGGARTEFAISAEEATPGYLAGPVNAGTWHVALGPYTVAPQGLDYEVTVTLTRGGPGRTPRPVHPPQRAAGRGRAWYRGDCHLHTVHSDGRRTPADVAAAARAAGLDFIVTTEHNTTSGHGAWQGLWGDDLLVLCGEEVTTRNGHFLALGTDPGTFIDWRYRARDGAYAQYTRRIHRAGGLVVPAHAHAACIGCSWKFGFTGADAVEVWNGPWNAEDELALAGWDSLLRHGDGWLPAMGNSDAHREPDVVGLPQTVVLADDLSRPAILAGIRSGRSWVAESAAVGLAFSVTDERGGHAGIGERLRAPQDRRVTVRLDVSGVPEGVVRLVTDQGVRHTAALPGGGSGTVTWDTTPANASHVRAEVRHPAPEQGESGLPGPMAAITNPVFLGAAGDR
ncbi:CehA/McbA family metallohydrolase [Streptomyces sp. MP131-18]|uniref:CehA/McbA family metallohydrolase n=1 Tax=Streptomyces sp. MP131-18 TaxID=1857892 RepID=UPI00097C3786|nr:CehA/McbA family metallohydrolase [Streptomyces sp. MP131-18]ONK13644.1 Histidinol phosphatase of the PHP family protein [Streptomyces sp. MP131-18]